MRIFPVANRILIYFHREGSDFYNLWNLYCKKKKRIRLLVNAKGEKMYTVYIAKYKGDIPDFNITRVISKYMSCTDYDCGIISSPGYMNVRVGTTDEFYDKLAPAFLQSSSTNTRHIEVGIFNGMNGSNHMKGTGNTCREQHEKSIQSHQLNLITLKCKRKIDHRKMLFFMELKDNFNEILSLENYEQFLHTVTVRGVMIGSSNQSLKTYYGGSGGGSADKGEADIFMFVDDEAKNSIMEDPALNESVVISRSLYVPGDSDTDYLKSILLDFLQNSLE